MAACARLPKDGVAARLALITMSVTSPPCLGPPNVRRRREGAANVFRSILALPHRVRCFLVILLAASALVVPAGSAPSTLTKVSLAAHPLALCNDGTPAAYYFRKAPSQSEQANIWVVYLQGGGECW